MKITPTGAAPQSAPISTSPAQSARDRAIAALINTGGPSVDANNISAEELPTVVPTTSSTDNTTSIEASTEAPETTEPQTEEEKEKYSKHLAHLARKERALRVKYQQQEQALKQREAELKSREAELLQKSQSYETGYVSKEQLRQNALQVLANEGIDVNTITEQLVNMGQVDPRVNAKIDQLSAQIEKLQKANEELLSKQQQQQDESYQAAVRQIRSDAARLIKDNPDYETIQATSSVGDVVELIERTFKEDGVLMSVQEAADEIENYLVEEALKFSKLKKIQSRLAPKPEPAQVQKQTQTAQKQPQPTLTNDIASTRQLSARDRAIAAMEGRLK